VSSELISTTASLAAFPLLENLLALIIRDTNIAIRKYVRKDDSSKQTVGLF